MKARDNPLRVERIERLIGFEPGWLGIDWPGLVQRLRQQNCRGAVVGPHGSGKTTFLKSLTERLRELEPDLAIHHLRLANQPDRRFATDDLTELQHAAARGDWIMIDGAEQIGPLQWRRVRRATKQAHGLVITRHRAGCLPLLLRTFTTPEMLELCLQRLFHPQPIHLDDAQIRQLWQRHRGNLREALWQAYGML